MLHVCKLENKFQKDSSSTMCHLEKWTHLSRLGSKAFTHGGIFPVPLHFFLKACNFVCIHTDIHKNSAHSS